MSSSLLPQSILEPSGVAFSPAQHETLVLTPTEFVADARQFAGPTLAQFAAKIIVLRQARMTRLTEKTILQMVYHASFLPKLIC